MENVIYYKDYIRRKNERLKKLKSESKKYVRTLSILNRLVDWRLADKN